MHFLIGNNASDGTVVQRWQLESSAEKHNFRKQGVNTGPEKGKPIMQKWKRTRTRNWENGCGEEDIMFWYIIFEMLNHTLGQFKSQKF